MYIVLCYDVTRDRHRDRLFRRLKKWLQPVQKSVFEGHVPDHRFGELLEMVSDSIDPRVDSVRIYHLCRPCQGLTDLVGASHAVTPAGADLIV